MGNLEVIEELAKTKPIDAGVMLCRGLMVHDPSDPLRQGYTIGNALIAAQDLLDLNGSQLAAVADRLVQPLVEHAQAVSEEFTAENEEGTTVDWYDNENLYTAVEGLRLILGNFGQQLPENAFTA